MFEDIHFASPSLCWYCANAGQCIFYDDETEDCIEFERDTLDTEAPNSSEKNAVQ